MYTLEIHGAPAEPTWLSCHENYSFHCNSVFSVCIKHPLQKSFIQLCSCNLWVLLVFTDMSELTKGLTSLHPWRIRADEQCPHRWLTAEPEPWPSSHHEFKGASTTEHKKAVSHLRFAVRLQLLLFVPRGGGSERKFVDADMWASEAEHSLGYGYMVQRRKTLLNPAMGCMLVLTGDSSLCWVRL